MTKTKKAELRRRPDKVGLGALTSDSEAVVGRRTTITTQSFRMTPHLANSLAHVNAGRTQSGCQRHGLQLGRENGRPAGSVLPRQIRSYALAEHHTVSCRHPDAAPRYASHDPETHAGLSSPKPLFSHQPVQALIQASRLGRSQVSWRAVKAQQI